jgi:hypothetical protein
MQRKVTIWMRDFLCFSIHLKIKCFPDRPETASHWYNVDVGKQKLSPKKSKEMTFVLVSAVRRLVKSKHCKCTYTAANFLPLQYPTVHYPKMLATFVLPQDS